MNLREFLKITLPESGNYYVATADSNSNFKQWKIGTKSELAEKIENITYQHKNVYFATGSFNNSRTAKGIKHKKIFYLDLDCGPGKEFPDKPTAGKELIAFIKKANILIPSIVVDSGNGLHVYWVLDTSINAKQWLNIAEALKAACEEYDFKADPVVTTDIARVLRAPETVNYKDQKHPRPCKIFSGNSKQYSYEEVRHAFLKWVRPTTLSTVPSALKNNGALSGGMHNQFVPLAKHMVPQCAVLAEVAATGGRGDDDPQSCRVGIGYKEVFWQQTLYLLAFCEDGHDYIHTVSEKHKTYSHKETEMKFGQQLIKAQDPGRKPTVCSTLEQYMPDKCAECPFKGKFKSPIALGKPPATEIPYGYIQDDKGIMRIEGDETLRILPYIIEDFNVGYDIAGHGLILSLKAVIAKTAYYIEFAHALLCDVRAIGKELSIHGIALNKHQLAEFIHLMTTWTQQMQRARQVRSTTRAFGWFEQGKRMGFAAGNNIYWNDGKAETSLVPYKDLAAMYTPTGSIDIWKEVANYIVKQDRPGINVAIASAFASPLVKFTGVSGLTLAIVSEKSGTGKSTGLKVAQSVWGHPVKGVNALSDTIASVVRKLGVLNNLPAYWDELRMREDVDGFIRLMFQIGQGKEKSRLTQSSNFQDMGTWNLLMTVASNEYLTDHIDQIIKSSDAGRRRVFEVTVDDYVDAKAIPANMAKFRSLEENFGLAGIEYSKYIATNHKYVEQLVHKYMEHFSKKLSTNNDERFWLAFISATAAGAHIAKKMWLVEFKVNDIVNYLAYEFIRMRGDINIVHKKQSIKALDFVVSYLNDNAANIATVDKLLGRGIKENTVTNQPDRKPVFAEISEETRWVRLDKSKFTKYVYENGGQPTIIIKDLEQHLPSMRQVRAAIGRGVFGSVGGRVRCLDIFMDDPAIAGYFK